MKFFHNAWQEIKHHPARFLATLSAIALSVGFLTAIQVFVATEMQAITLQRMSYATKADGVAETGWARSKETAADVTDALVKSPHIQSVDRIYESVTSFDEDDFASLYVVPKPEFRWHNISEGRNPENNKEVVLARKTANKLHAKVGSEIKANMPGGIAKLTVVGLTDDPGLFGLPAYLGGQPDTSLEHGRANIVFKLKPGANVDQVRSQIKDVLASKNIDLGKSRGGDPSDEKRTVEIKSADELRKEKLKETTGDRDISALFISAFGGVALLVGAIIIAITFTILITQRRRQVGLLRAVGAQKSQVRRRFAAEAILLGLVGSTLGVALGLGVATAGSGFLTKSLTYGLAIPWVNVGIAFAIGVLATVLAALFPIRKAIKVTPLEALHPVDTVEEKRKFALVRAIVCSLLVIAGGLLAWGSLTWVDVKNGMPLIVAVVAAILISLGVLFGASLFVPQLVHLVGKLVDYTGPESRLAASNATRNPGRTAATAAVLMMTIGLIVTLQTASATLKTSMGNELGAKFPIDLVIQSGYEHVGYEAPPEGGSGSTDGKHLTFSNDALKLVKNTSGIADAKLVHTTEPLMVQYGEPNSGSMSITTHSIATITPELQQVLAVPITLKDDEIALSAEIMSQNKMKDGDLVQVGDEWPRGPTPHDASGNYVSPKVENGVVFKAKASNAAGFFALVTPTGITKIKHEPKAYVIAAKLTEIDDALKVQKAVKTVLTDAAPGAHIRGGAVFKAQLENMLNTLLLVVTCLLGVAILIAVIGMGNTLGLSVLERTRESALLRALGLPASGLRVMLLVEALLLSTVSLIVGMVAGIFFGWLGSKAAYRAMEFQHYTFTLDPKLTAIVIAVALVSGALASVLPGRRAAKAMPVEALADIG